MSDRAFVDLLVTSARAIGVTFPKPVVTALADRQRIAERIAAMRSPSTSELEAALFTALLEDRDPYADETVRAIVTARTIGGESGRMIEQYVGEAAVEHVKAALTKNATTIYDAIKDKADTAGRDLTAAHLVLGDLGLDQSASVLQLGVVAGEAWVGAKNASKAIDQADNAWTMMARLTGTASATDPTSLRLADLDLDTYDKVGRKATPWDIVRAGAAIDFATPATAKARVQRINAEREARNNAAPTFADTYQRTRGIGRPKVTA